MKSRMEAVIFDMDGVLLDSEPYHFQAEQELFRRYGLTIPPREQHRFVGIPAGEMWRQLKERFSLPQPLDDLLTADREERIRFFSRLNDLRPTPGVRALLRELVNAGIATAIASSSSREIIVTLTDKLGINDYFRVMVSAESVTRGKPSPDIYRETARLLGHPPRRCLVIEDAAAGVTAAKAAGMTCIGFKNPSSGGQNISHADTVVSSLTGMTLSRLIDIHTSAINSLSTPPAEPGDT